MLRKDIDKEKEVVQCMIELYCRGNHKPEKNRLCVQCQELSDYALKRLDLCPFGNSKPFCSNCKIHCYQKDMRIRIRNVMRYSRPRMLFYYPHLAIRHLFLGITRKERRPK